MPDSATAHDLGGAWRRQPGAARSVSTSKVRRSRWFTPMSSAPASSARSSSSSSCTSTSASRPRAPASCSEARELVVVERGHDEQHRVGPHQPGVADVVRRHGEVLAQHRQRRPRHAPRARSAGRPRRTPRRSAPTGRPRPPPRRRAASTAGSSPGASVALGRRAALHLGDDGEAGAPRRPATARRVEEGPGRGRPRQGRRHVADAAIVRREPGAVIRHDAVQVGGHHQILPAPQGGSPDITTDRPPATPCLCNVT